MKFLKKKRGVFTFLIASVIVIILLRIILNDSLSVKTYTVDSPYTESEHVFAVVADLHSTLYGKGQRKLIAEIEAVSPEAVFFVGDIGDNRRDFHNTAMLIEALVELYPCYYVPGNHERWVDYTDDIRKLFESYGVTPLSEESADLGDGIVLHGIDDPVFYDRDRDFCSALAEIEVTDEAFDILLSHRPEYAELYRDCGFDLTLSGHAHGGQIRIPYLLNGLYAPKQGFFPSWAGGQYDLGGSLMIVSRGLMKNELPRVFNRPELVVVKIK